MKGIVVDEQMLGNVSPPLVPWGVVMNIAVFHLLVGEAKPLLCEFAIVVPFPRKRDAYFFVHKTFAEFIGRSGTRQRNQPTQEVLP